MDDNMMNPFPKPSLREQELTHKLNEYRKLGTIEHLQKLVEMEKACAQIKPASKTVAIWTKDGSRKIAVLPAYLQSNYDIGYWLQDNIEDFDHWCFAGPSSHIDIRYDLKDFEQEQNLHFDDNPIISANPFYPVCEQTAVIDTVQSRIFWIHKHKDSQSCRLCCNHYLIGKNMILWPALITEDFDDSKKAWETLLEIKRKPHMAFIAMASQPSYRMFDKLNDVKQLMAPAIDHIMYLESQLAEMQPALDAYKRTGWEPCDYSLLSHYKNETERLKSENQELQERLIKALERNTKLEAENANLVDLMNHM